MKAEQPRVIAANIISEVLAQGRSLDQALSQGLQQCPLSQEHSLIQEMCYGVLRWYWRLNSLAKLLLHQPFRSKDSDLEALLLVGLYQLFFMRTPNHAAIAETVEGTKLLRKPWATGVLNAVLRTAQRQQEALINQLNLEPVTQYAHSRWMIDQLQQAWPEYWRAILTANNQRPPMTLRVNKLKTTRAQYLKQLGETGIMAEACEYAQDGINLLKPQSVGSLPGFAEGFFAVQDAAAQLAADLMELEPQQRVLDACAAPGGKTTHIYAIQPALAELVALDKDPARVEKLQENCLRLGVKARILTSDAMQPKDWWDGQLFDRILLDAPCSGTGVIRRHPDIKIHRQSSDLPRLQATQYALLEALWSLLKPGGILLYATCSVLPSENEECIQRFLSEYTDATEVPINAEWGFKVSVGRQILPEQQGMDGFYYAKLKRASR